MPCSIEQRPAEQLVRGEEVERRRAQAEPVDVLAEQAARHPLAVAHDLADHDVGVVGDRDPVEPLQRLGADPVVTSQALVVRDVPEPGRKTIYVGTSTGVLYALDDGGFERARVQLGALELPDCQWLPDGRYGITGTPAVDPRTGTLYAADAQGMLHALDPVTLEERAGWPVRLYGDPSARLVWGALTIVGDTLYVGTGGLCGRAPGLVLAVDLTTGELDRWTSVPPRLGGGGGIWGWGGPAYDRRTRSVLVATGNALPGGRNTGKRFNEAAGYAVHVVRLSPALDVLAANAPVSYRKPLDLDMSGTPVVVRAPGCPALVAAENKNGFLYVWRLGALDDGVVWSKRLAPKLNGQPAWSPVTRSLYVVGHSAAFRLQLTRRCAFRVVWKLPLGSDAVNGPPTVAGNVVLFAVSEDYSIWAVDARSGQVLWRGPLGEAVFAAPAVLDGRIYVGGFSGRFQAFG